MPKKYELAWSNRHNCSDPGDHVFRMVMDKEVIAEIKSQHPKFYDGIPTWICSNCDKVVQSM